MPPLKRRQFLQFAASTIATLGLSQLDLQHQSLRYARAIAQSTPRKRALLIGVNNYAQDIRFTHLKGCTTDVQLQRELLIHRFGFSPDDVLILTDDTPTKPTRNNILAAFKEHLIAATQPGDIAVFHFSGHGDRVLDPNPIRQENGEPVRFNSTFVPFDSKVDRNDDTVPDIMGKTLFLLASQINTEHVTLVLDSCHSGGGTRGNIRIRSRSGDHIDRKPASIELEYQQRLMEQLQLTPEQLMQRRSESVAQGVVIASAQRDQKAFDAQFNFSGQAADASFSGFDAGVFTYFMSQYLWQETATAESAIAQVGRSLQGQFSQQPLVDPKKGSGFERQPMYFVTAQRSSQISPAEAVMIGSNGDRGTIWLGGIERNSLATFEAGAMFTPVGSTAEVRIVSRQGLIAEVESSVPLPAGTLLQESARTIPQNFALRIGLDPSLKNDTVLAQRTLQSLRRIQPVPFQSGNTPYSGEVQYILSRMTQAYQAQFLRNSVTHLPAVGSMGLFSQGLDEIIPDSFGSVTENIEAAIDRLSSKLTALAATRLVKLVLNARASRLKLEAVIQKQNGQALIAQAFTPRGGTQPTLSGDRSPLQSLTLCDAFQIKLINHESTPLYVCVLGIDASDAMTLLFPNQFSATRDTSLVQSNHTVSIPSETDPFEFIAESQGTGTILVLASRSPLRQSLLQLANLAPTQAAPSSCHSATEFTSDGRGGKPSPHVPSTVPVDNTIADLLSDLSNSRGGNGEANHSSQISVTEMGALLLTLEVK
jgi:Caspase domain/Domain of unknown function (DUF4384)